MFRNLAAVAVLLCSSAVWAQDASPVNAQNVATLETIDGSVLLNQGVEFAPGAVGQPLSENDRIMAEEGNSSAVIHYEDGCDFKVNPATIVTIPKDSPCACGIARDQSVEPHSAPQSPAENAQGVAELRAIKGNVSVNRGVEFVPALAGQSLNENDRVMAEEGESSALIHYADGCGIKVNPGTIVTVPEDSRCPCDMLWVQNAAPAGGAVIGAAVFNPLPIVFGTIVTGIIYLLINGDEDDEETVSP